MPDGSLRGHGSARLKSEVARPKLPLPSGKPARMLSLGANTSDLRMPGLNFLGPKLFFALEGICPHVCVRAQVGVGIA